MEMLVAVNDQETRERFTPAAIRGFTKLAEVWNLTSQEQIDLLGASVSRGTLRNWAEQPRSILNADQLMRISLLLGVYEALQRLWRRAPAEADAWVRRKSVQGPFHGLRPIEFMQEGGILGLAATRTYLEGLTGGPPSREDYRQPPREGL